MSSVEYHTILRYRLMIPLIFIDEVCPIYCKTYLDIFGEHTIYCKEFPNFKYRYDFVRDALFDLFRRAEIYVKTTMLMNYLTDPQEGISTLKPTNVLMYNLVGEKYAFVDLTKVSPLVGLRTGDFTVRHAVLKAASNKMIKHKNTFSNQHDFITFAYDTFGFLVLEALDLLQRFQRLIYSNVVSLGQ